MAGKLSLYARIAAFILATLSTEVRRALKANLIRLRVLTTGSTPAEERTRNIVIVGANFAGYHAARLIATTLPARTLYRVVVVEPNSHFQFTWVLPRYCVAKGHEHKAFIPYGGYVAGAPEGAIRWIQDRVLSVSKGSVQLQGSGEEIPYEYLVIATGSEVKEGLPSRSNATEKDKAIRRLQNMQSKIESAKTVVVVGGGAAGVEVATDAKSLYPEKHVILIHSRAALMHRFGEKLQEAAMEGMQKLGGEVILNDRVVDQDEAAGIVTLRSGRVIECDCYINCTGQAPSSGLIAGLSPHSVEESGHIKVKPTLQIADDALSNIYICGDVAGARNENPNARAAMRQATVVADNIIRGVEGKGPSRNFEPFWADGFIKLTLGMGRSVVHLGDDQLEVLFSSNKDKEELMAADAWRHMGAKPFEDNAATGKEQQ